MKIVKADFDPVTLEDELRVDTNCRQLLLEFYNHMTETGMAPDQATRLANGADYFVRDFVVDARRCNLFDEQPGLVWRFAGNWYIVNTLEPGIDELKNYLAGIAAFYRYLRDQGAISSEYCQVVEQECGLDEFYRQRIDDFWSISDDGYLAWEQACSLKD